MPLPEPWPLTAPYDEGMLDVGDGHALRFEQSGNPDGLPAVVLHGGPGSGAGAGWRRYFDPARFRIVVFDQRNCGGSTPSAAAPVVDLSTNTTGHLVADIERLRGYLGIERWLVMGASWGTTLGLAYAQAHPDRVLAMAFGAVTSGSRREVEWVTRDMGRVFPREWERFVEVLPRGEREGNLAAAYSRLLHDPDPDVRERAAVEWCRWEDTHVSTMPGWAPDARYDDPDFRLTFARLVTHYWGHDCFLEDDAVLRGVEALREIPTVLVHGRLDVSSPLATAWELVRHWPEAELVVADDAGHGGGSWSAELRGAVARVADRATA